MGINFYFVLKGKLKHCNILSTIFNVWEMFTTGHLRWAFHHFNEVVCSKWCTFQQWDKCTGTLDWTSLLNFGTTSVTSAIKDYYRQNDLGFAVTKVGKKSIYD
jgi:hypothetical protein